jgi:putative endopeptidase
MIRNALVAGASALAMAVAIAVPASAQDGTESAPPQMHFGSWGIDPASLDPSVDPGDDFYAYVNGKWARDNPIPAEYGRYATFNFLDEKSKTDVQVLVDELVASDPAPGTKERRIVDAFAAFLDSAAIDERGLAPIYPLLTRLFEAPDVASLVILSAEPAYPTLVGAGITIDAKDPDNYIPSVGFDGMGLPDRDLYLEDSEVNREIQAKYREFLAFMLGKAGYADPEAAARAVYDFEHQVAELEWDRVALRNRDLTYHKLTRAELEALAPSFPVARLIDSQGLPDVATFLAPQLPPSDEDAVRLGLSEEMRAGIGGGLPAMMQLIERTPPATLKAYLAVRLLSNYAPVLPSEIDQANFAFFGGVLNGIEEQRPRWKRALDAVEGQLGEVLGKAYAERYFPVSSKEAMIGLVANLRKALGQSLDENAWMSDVTKVRAHEKLEAFVQKIGFPDEFETYEGLEISADDPLGNMVSAAQWQWNFDRARLGQPIDRGEWFMLPQEVNAYYSPVMNEIVFPAAILQQPFFGPDADMAVNYGAIGAVIGHEIGHGFDDQGSKYDATGKLENWWSDGDRKAFDALGNRLVAQYDAFCPLDEGKTCVNGRFTLGENIGDLAGINLAYRAYKMALGGKEAPVIDGLTGDQRFFLAFAQVWRSTIRDENMRQRLQTDSHSPSQFRANGPVRNVDAWYEAFGVTPDDDLYLPPEERVIIW